MAEKKKIGGGSGVYRGEDGNGVNADVEAKADVKLVIHHEGHCA